MSRSCWKSYGIDGRGTVACGRACHARGRKYLDICETHHTRDTMQAGADAFVIAKVNDRCLILFIYTIALIDQRECDENLYGTCMIHWSE